MASELEKRIDRLESIEEIKKMIGLYARAGDAKNDPKIFGKLLSEDAVWECEGFGRFEGRETILRELSGVAQERILWALHFMTTPIVEIGADGTSATAFWYLWETAKARESAGAEAKSTWIGGWYESKLARRGGKWKWTYIRLFLKLFSPNAKPEWDTLP